MRKFFVLAAVAAAVALMSGVSASAQELKRLPLDDAKTTGLRLETDAKVKAEGTASLKITTLWPTTVCLGEVAGLDIQDAKLFYRAKVKSEMEGMAFLEMWCHVAGGQYFSRGMNSTVSGTMDWQTLEAPFFLEKGQRPERVTLNLVINGKGIVWVDDVVLSKEPLR